MKYAIIQFKEKTGWARVVKENKNGSVRIQLFRNWAETIPLDRVKEVVEYRGQNMDQIADQYATPEFPTFGHQNNVFPGSAA